MFGVIPTLNTRHTGIQVSTSGSGKVFALLVTMRPAESSLCLLIRLLHPCEMISVLTLMLLLGQTATG